MPWERQESRAGEIALPPTRFLGWRRALGGGRPQARGGSTIRHTQPDNGVGESASVRASRKALSSIHKANYKQRTGPRRHSRRPAPSQRHPRRGNNMNDTSHPAPAVKFLFRLNEAAHALGIGRSKLFSSSPTVASRPYPSTVAASYIVTSSSGTRRASPVSTDGYCPAISPISRPDVKAATDRREQLPLLELRSRYLRLPRLRTHRRGTALRPSVGALRLPAMRQRRRAFVRMSTRMSERSLVDALCIGDFSDLPAHVQERLRQIGNHRFFPTVAAQWTAAAEILKEHCDRQH